MKLFVETDADSRLAKRVLKVRKSFPIHSALKPVQYVCTVPCSVADPDPGSGAFLTPGSGIPDPKPIFLRGTVSYNFFE